MTAAVAVMSAATTSTVPKRHGFSIESLIGKQETSAAPSPPTLSSPPRPVPIRPVFIRGEAMRDDIERSGKHREAEKCDHRTSREKEMRGRDKESREKDFERDVDKQKILTLDSVKDFREMRDREHMGERDMREIRDNREGRGSDPTFQRISPHPTSPSSPRAEKSLTPESENRLSMWPEEELKHLLVNFHNNQLDSSGIYQPLRVCNRTLVSIAGGVTAASAPPNPLGVGMPPHFPHLPINPLLYNMPRDIAHPSHPLLTSRYPAFLHPRYHIGPPPGLLFHPYRKPKRNRTAFSPSQLLQLEQAFEKNHYVVGQERKSLAAKLQLTETQVKVWFQNRRTKHKRMKAEEDEGCQESQGESHDGEGEKEGSGGNSMSYVEDEVCSEEDVDEEELSVTEDC